MSNQQRWMRAGLGMACAAGLGAAAVLAAPSGASAANGQALILGATNTATGATFLDSNSWFSLVLDGGVLTPRAEIGEPLEDDEPIHNYAMVVSGGGLEGALFTGAHNAVAAKGMDGHAMSAYGVGGTDGGPALSVDQASPGGRGATFSGPAAQIQLHPAAGSHPKSGQRGDLFVDKDGKLWFCKGGTTWKQIA